MEQSRLLATVLIAHQLVDSTKGQGRSGEGRDLGRTRFAEIEYDELAGDRKQRDEDDGSHLQNSEPALGRHQ